MVNKTDKKIILEMYGEGWKVSIIAKTVSKGQSTIYKILQEDYDKNRFPILKDLITKALLQEDFTQFIRSLTYRDICLLRRTYKLSGFDKETKIKAILAYFKHFSILGIYPDDLTRDSIKKAFFRKAKEVHPDLNKRETKRGEKFQEVYQSYNYLLTIHT
ncbi:hypothetical protein LCGC14_1292500 [marine sediment metagenome]|uniref:J domain-containing protein n=1 Tax=marine sediment metagenome TaxID=412755 RepID=A0A0F9KTP5_9ZZZZ